MHDIFSATGRAAWRARLDASPDFHDAAAGWTGTILLRDEPESGAARRSWIALDDGAITSVRAATASDEGDAQFVIAAPSETWRALMAGRRDLAAAAMAGEINLVRGSIWKLMPHVKAATALLKAAGSVR